MFEDSLFSSGPQSGPQSGSKRVRWAAALAAAVQGVCLALVLVVPLLHPAMLPAVVAAPRVVLLERAKPMPKPVVARVAAARTASVALAAPAPEPATARADSARRLLALPANDSPAPPVSDGFLNMGESSGAGGGSLASLLRPSGSGTRAVPRPAAAVTAPSRVRMSSGVVAGLLLAPIAPAYPPITKAAHVQGTVVLRATIDRQGRIQDLQVIDGPELLRSAAVEAVSRARYRPFRLNGEPTEVETTISVNFRLGT